MPDDLGNTTAQDAAHLGACSLNHFALAPPLRHSHEDVRGFVEWFRRTEPTPPVPAFWLRDHEVRGNLYAADQRPHNRATEPRCHMDGTTVFYHTGHGITDLCGVFHVPLGAFWHLRPWTDSRSMRIGYYQCRYVFWSTCRSLRIRHGQSPVRTWNTANRGFRMMFGCESRSLDSPDYGRVFGQCRDAGYPFAMAWLTANSLICTSQVPTVVACGATEEEAIDRLDQEREFHTGWVSKRHWVWRSLDPGRPARAMTTAVPDVPRTLDLAAIDPLWFEQMSQRLGSSGPDLPDAAAPIPRVDPSGRFTLRLGPFHASARDATPAGAAGPADAPAGHSRQVTPESAVTAAEQTLAQVDPDGHLNLVLDRIMTIHQGSATNADSTRGVRSTGTAPCGFVVRYRQTYHGLVAVSPAHGLVDLVVDARATVTSVSGLLRPSEKPTDDSYLVRGTDGRVDPGAPGPVTPPGGAPGPVAPEVRRALDASLDRTLRWFARSGRRPARVSVVPHTTEVGYQVPPDAAGQPSTAVLTARQVVCLDFGWGMSKLYQVEAPLT